jgi:predicted nucleic acid-binding protein
MSGEKILIDTNIALYLLDGDATLAKALDQKEIFLSVISEMELLSYPKITEVEIERIKAFVADCNLLELTPSIKDKTITIRRNYNLKLPDAIIAATAIQANISLISADSMFKRIKELNFVEYIIS